MGARRPCRWRRSDPAPPRTRCGSYRHLRLDRRMELVLLEPRDPIEKRAGLLAGARARHDVVVARDDLVEVAKSWIHCETRGGIRLARELLAHGLDVIAVDVRVGEH